MYLAGTKTGEVFFCHRLLVIICLAASVFWGSKAIAFNVQYGLTHSVESTSNVLLAPETSSLTGIEDKINTSLIYVNLVESRSAIEMSADIQLSYLDYGKDDVSRDVTRNSLDSEILWNITPGRFSWFVEDNYLQTTIDPSLIFNQTNTQDVNEFGTGPQFKWIFKDTTLNLETYIYNYDYSETDNDATNSITNLRWGKKMPSGMNLYLVYSTTFVTYESDSVLSDYDKSSLSLNYQYTRATNDFDVEIGKTYLNDDENSDSSFTNIEMSFTRRMSRHSNINMSYSSGLADQSETIDAGGTLLSNVFENQTSLIRYQKTSSALGLVLEVVEIIRSNEESGFEDYLRTAEISISRVVAPRSQIQLSYSDSDNRVDNLIDYTDSIIEKRFEYTKRFNDSLSFRFFVSDLAVSSNFDIREYTDKRVGLSLSIAR